MDDEALHELIPGLARLWSAWSDLEAAHVERLAAPAMALGAAQDPDQQAA